MRLHLKWIHWYCTVALAPGPHIQELLDYPVVESSWKRRNVDHTLVRFGLEIHDLAGRALVVPLALGEGRSELELEESTNAI